MAAAVRAATVAPVAVAVMQSMAPILLQAVSVVPVVLVGARVMEGRPVLERIAAAWVVTAATVELADRVAAVSMVTMRDTEAMAVRVEAGVLLPVAPRVMGGAEDGEVRAAGLVLGLVEK